MEKKRTGLRLSTFIVALSFGGVLMVSTLFAVSSYLSAQRLIEQEIQQSFDYRYRIVQLNLEEKLLQISGRLSILSDLLPLIQAVEGKRTRDVEDILFDVMQSEETRNLDVLILSDQKGEIVGDASSLLSPLTPLIENLYDGLPGVYEKWFLVEMDDQEHTHALVYSVPIIEREFGQVIGAVHAAISVSSNTGFAKELMGAAEFAQLYLANDDGVLAQAGSPLAANKLAVQDIKSLFEGPHGRVVRVDDFVGATQNIQIGEDREQQLQVIAFMQRDGASALLREYRVNGILLVVGALVTSLLITYMIRRLMRNSSLRLSVYVDQVTKGNRKVRFTPGPVREFNHLGEVIGNMVATIQENERYLTNLIDLAPSPIVAWDGEGRIVRLNKSAERILGCCGQEVLNHPVQSVIAAISRIDGGEVSVLERSLSGAVIEGWEMSHENLLNGQTHYMSWSISPVMFDEGHEVTTVLAQGLDMTRRKQAEQELQRVNQGLEKRVAERTSALEEEIVERRQIEAHLRASEERFRDIAQASSDWFWEMGPDLCFTYMSDKALKVTGFLEEQVIGKSRFELVGEVQRTREADKWAAHQALLERQEPFRSFEYSIANKHGEERVFRISGVPIFNGKNGEFLGYRGSGRDVTDEYLHAQELQIAKEEAESANHAKTEFLSSMSHELRTPLNGILGFAQLLQMPRGTPLADNQKEFINQIVKAGNHLLTLINDILDLSKIEAREVQISHEPVSPDRVMQDVITLLSELARKNDIEVINEVPREDDFQLYADYTRLKQVLVNLGGNAIKYNRANGQVRFTCALCEDEEMVQFNVIDTGIGIDPDKRKDLFIPFNRLNAENSGVEGTGIGLAITQRLVGLMGGYMGVDSTPGEGSDFWFRLPLYLEQKTNAVQPVKSFMPVNEKDLVLSRDITLLYVEDNPNNSALMRDALVQMPQVSLHIVSNAEEGLDYIRDHDIDLLFLDINLPGMNGWEMMDTLKRKKKSVSFPVVAVTAQVMDSDLKRAREAGFDDFLPKPIHLKDVFRLIRQYTQVN